MSRGYVVIEHFALAATLITSVYAALIPSNDIGLKFTIRRQLTETRRRSREIVLGVHGAISWH